MLRPCGVEGYDMFGVTVRRATCLEQVESGKGPKRVGTKGNMCQAKEMVLCPRSRGRY